MISKYQVKYSAIISEIQFQPFVKVLVKCAFHSHFLVSFQIFSQLLIIIQWFNLINEILSWFCKNYFSLRHDGKFCTNKNSTINFKMKSLKAIGGSGVIFTSEAYLKVLNPAEWPLFTELRYKILLRKYLRSKLRPIDFCIGKWGVKKCQNPTFKWLKN